MCRPLAQFREILTCRSTGNLLDEEQVRALEGKVSFETRYETRTRLVDEFGNEVEEDSEAGTKAEGVDEPTINVFREGEGSVMPPVVPAKQDVLKEKAKAGDQKAAEPEGEVGKETGKDEL